MEQDIDASLGEIRRLVYNLRPPALDELELLGALRETTAVYARATVVEADHASDRCLCVCLDAPDYLPPLPAAVEVAAYRIVQEALANVVRHAHAASCQVRIWLDAGVRLEIADDGRGLAAQRRSGVGLTSMRERAEELGGWCRVEAGASGGTRVLAWLPCPAPVEVGR